MKIAIINQHRQDVLGGSEIQCDIIANQLLELGHTPIYCVVSPKGPSYGTAYMTVPLPRLGFMAVWRLLRRVRPQVVYWRHNKKGVLGALAACRLLGIPFIFSISHVRDVRKWTLHGEAPFARYHSILKRPDMPFHRKMFSVLNLRTLLYLLDPLRSYLIAHSVTRLAAGVVTNNKDFSGNIPTHRLCIIQNSAIQGLEPFNWPRPFIVWVANIKTRKNPDLFLLLAREFEGNGVDFLMVGAIHSEQYRFLEKQHALKNFHYLGKKTPSEINGILSQSLFLVHTCNPEGFPNIFIQAWTQGKPTITLLFDPSGFIETHSLGFYSKNFDTLVRNTRTLIGDVSLRDKIGKRATEIATTNFDPQENVRALDLFLQEVAVLKMGRKGGGV